MKSKAPFFRTDIVYMTYLDVKYFSVVFLSIYLEKQDENDEKFLGKEVKLLSVRHNL